MAAQEPAEGDKALWRRWRSWLIVSLAVLAALALLALALVVLPPLVVPPGKPSFADLAKAESDVRGNLVAALGVLAVLIGAVVGFLNFRESQLQNLRSLDLSRRGQVSERFSKAIEQLGQSGADRVDVRIGAAYSLEQIAEDSPDELHAPIMEILAAFLREHSDPRVQQSVDKPLPLRADFQAVGTVLGRRDWRRDTQRLNLIGVDLRRGLFPRAYLAGAGLG